MKNSQGVTIITIIESFNPAHRETQRKLKERQVLRPCQRTKKVIKHEGDSDTNYNWCTREGPQSFNEGLGSVETKTIQKSSWRRSRG